MFSLRLIWDFPDLLGFSTSLFFLWGAGDVQARFDHVAICGAYFSLSLSVLKFFICFCVGDGTMMVRRRHGRRGGGGLSMFRFDQHTHTFLSGCSFVAFDMRKGDEGWGMGV